MSDHTTETDERVWFPDDQHGYSIAICVCAGGAYLGARRMGTPCRCEECGRLTREQWDFLVEHVTADLRMQYEASQGALSDLLTEHRELREAIEATARKWEQRCDSAAITYQDAEQRSRATAPGRAFVRDLRALNSSTAKGASDE